HPVPLSNLVVEENRSRSHPAQANVPRLFSCRSGLVKGCSVPSLRRTANWSGVNSVRHSASVRVISNFSAASIGCAARRLASPALPPSRNRRLVVTGYPPFLACRHHCNTVYAAGRYVVTGIATGVERLTHL